MVSIANIATAAPPIHATSGSTESHVTSHHGTEVAEIFAEDAVCAAAEVPWAVSYTNNKLPSYMGSVEYSNSPGSERLLIRHQLTG